MVRDLLILAFLTKQGYTMIHETNRKCRSTGSSKTTSGNPVGARYGHSRSSPADRGSTILCETLEGPDRERRKEALMAKPHPGRTPRLSPEQRKELLGLLLEGPLAHGYANQLWTLPRIARAIEDHFGVRYHPAHVWKILHACGWSCQKPQRWSKERDEEQIHAPAFGAADMGAPRADTNTPPVESS
jgi:transposase